MSAYAEQHAAVDDLAERIRVLADGRSRLLVAIAGAPGSGKSTLSSRLCDRLNGAAAKTPAAAVVPMDGFHLDDTVLTQQGMLARKGAPFTFDFGGLDALLGRLARNDEDAIAVPLFDRDLEIARAGARLISRNCPIILVEGNYLLLDQAPWSAIRRHFDLTVALDVPLAVLEDRLVARWLEQGFTLAAAQRRARENDLVNARLVRQSGIDADLVVAVS
ncbi:nucleoside/nucleotide kinase family protein [Martelella sp. HB161492]|uniref:nucleoside/nucleotide kinase family protein n=1 Tax=Martelella sp. HB161492 TaxID=2720726 RepID=UPI00158FE28E|nr:nucleoside/nucleotide kinase family protein [Martelella sp. HB161492]